MKAMWKGAPITVVVLLGVMLLAACGGGGGETKGDSAGPTPTETGGVSNGIMADPVVITIANLTDLTGAAAAGMETVNKAVEDVVRYYNEEVLIPGVWLKVITYDTTFDPARDVAAYDWALKNGADLVWSGIPSMPDSIRERVNEEGVCLFAPAVAAEVLTPPGHVFCVAIVPQHDAYTLLKWIADNDWDWRTRGPAKVGGVGWTDAYTPGLLAAAEAYCQAHPEQFEWVGGRLTGYKFSWVPEAESLKDTDYVFPPALMTNFLKQYREVGGRGKLLLGEPSLAFLGMVGDAGLWEELEGSLVARNSLWWDEQGELIDLAREVLKRYHPDQAEAIINQGVGYLGFASFYVVGQIIKHAVEQVGAEGFNSDALYDAAQSFTLNVDGVDVYSFGQTKRCASNFVRVYAMDAEREGPTLVSDGWYPVQLSP